jgi:hypothetical protein
MVEKIDNQTVCAHAKAHLSGLLPDEEIQRMVGYLNSLEPQHYYDVCKDIATVMTNAMLGKFNLDRSSIPSLAVTNHVAKRKNLKGEEVPGNTYKLGWLNSILSLEPSADTLKVWSGLTNLKSAAVIKQLSRSEKDAAYRV